MTRVVAGPAWPAVEARPRPWADVATRLALLPLLAAYLAAPGWSIVASPAVQGPLRIALLALAAIAVARPAWSPALIIGLVPLLPVWPSLVPTVPDGVVHLVVATQAIPWIVRRVVGRRGAGTSMTGGWAVVVGVATVSLLVSLTPEPWRGLTRSTSAD